MTKAKWVVAVVLILGIAGTVLASGVTDISELPGYVDVETVFGSARPNVEVCLKGSLLSVISTIAKCEEPDLGEALADLDLVRVFVFEDADLVEQKEIGKTADRLKETGWEQIVSVREDKDAESVTILTKMGENDRLVGFAVFVFEPGNEKKNANAVFVNIAGNLDLVQIAKVSHKLGLPPLTELTGMDKKALGELGEKQDKAKDKTKKNATG